ncbi:lipoprotein 17-related variable surface protein [Mycoplasmopsis pulmonis]|uniref:lipoprotein 17-related variable surface protein n=1 Tax=Mycoplasmopsis pulmonis TaxID=2107 RepID=UPI002FE647D0
MVLVQLKETSKEKVRLPSNAQAIESADVTLLGENNAELMVPNGITLTIEHIRDANEKAADDAQGSLKVKVKLVKENDSQEKVVTLLGLKKTSTE